MSPWQRSKPAWVTAVAATLTVGLLSGCEARSGDAAVGAPNGASGTRPTGRIEEVAASIGELLKEQARLVSEELSDQATRLDKNSKAVEELRSGIEELKKSLTELSENLTTVKTEHSKDNAAVQKAIEETKGELESLRDEVDALTESFSAFQKPGVRVPTEGVVVYVTRTGQKYHRGGCQYLRQSSIPMTLTQARTRYSPCSVCGPPR